MYIDKESFEVWMERIMDRFDHTDKAFEKLNKRDNMLEGERLYDNQDICQLLNISKRLTALQEQRGLAFPFDLPQNVLQGKRCTHLYPYPF